MQVGHPAAEEEDNKTLGPRSFVEGAINLDTMLEGVQLSWSYRD